MKVTGKMGVIPLRVLPLGFKTSKNVPTAAGCKTAFFRSLTVAAVLIFFCGISNVYGQDSQSGKRAPIDVNLIIDASQSFSSAALKDEIITWVSGRLDAILTDGDRVTVWSAGPSAKVVYTGRINGAPDRDAAKKSLRDISASSGSADFSGALREASSRQSSSFSYTLLISASPQALSSVLSGSQANLLRFSRVEEFAGWRALVVGLNLDTRVKQAADNFMGS